MNDCGWTVLEGFVEFLSINKSLDALNADLSYQGVNRRCSTAGGRADLRHLFHRGFLLAP